MILALIWWPIIGLIAGWTAGRIMKDESYGMVLDSVLGMAGSIIGGVLLGFLGIHGEGPIGMILISIIGAVILIWVSRQLKSA